MPDSNRFQLVVLKGDWRTLGLGYHAPEAQARLSAALPGGELFAAGLDDVAWYDWSRQRLALAQAATERLAEALAQARAAEGAPPYAGLTALKQSLGWSNPLERALYTRPFVVRLDGEPLYGGIFLDLPSQMAIDYPVIRVTLDEGQAVLHLLPVHVPFELDDPLAGGGDGALALADAGAPADEPVEADVPPGARAAFRDLAAGSTAAAFRRLIADPRVRAIVAEAGKLAA